MCCILAIAALIGPRVAIVVWWLLDPARWSAAFGGALLWPILGFLFLPLTTLAWVALAAFGIIGPVGIVLLVVALVIDLSSYGGGYRSRSVRRSTDL